MRILEIFHTGSTLFSKKVKTPCWDFLFYQHHTLRKLDKHRILSNFTHTTHLNCSKLPQHSTTAPTPAHPLLTNNWADPTAVPNPVPAQEGRRPQLLLSLSPKPRTVIYVLTDQLPPKRNQLSIHKGRPTAAPAPHPWPKNSLYRGVSKRQ